MDRKRSSWQCFKATLFIFMPLYILTCAILWIFFRLEVASNRNTRQIQAYHTVNLQKHRIANDFNLIVADLLFFANYSQLAAMLKDYPVNKQRLTSDLALFSRGAKIYDQVRIISADGKESIRINFAPGTGPVIVKEKDLQFKKDRYYFMDTYRLQKGEIFVSPLDLNIEHGEVERPLKPMIRFGTTIFDKDGRKQGIIIFNYLAANLIRDLEELMGASHGQCIMLNSEGYWLIHKSRPKLEWGFMFDTGRNMTMKTEQPQIWQEITAQDTGQFSCKKGLYTFTTIYPLLEGWKSSTGAGQAFEPSVTTKEAKEYFWKIVLYLPQDILTAGPDRIQTRYTSFSVLAFIILAVIAFLFARAKLAEKQAVEELHRSHANLENTVKERTEELVKTHRTFESLVESTVGHFGQDFFDNLVSKLCSILGCQCAIIGRITESDSVNVLAMMLDGGPVKDFSYDLYGTPCDNVSQKGFCHYPDGLCDLFPEDVMLAEINAVGYVGVPVVDGTGKAIGILCAISRSRLELPPEAESTMSVLAARAAAEIERMQKEQESRELAQKLQQSQKLEAIGTLAGGIAHDFNNILSAIIGHTQLSMQDAPHDSDLAQSLENILQAGFRAKGLVQQILAFSRQTQVEKKPFNPQPVIKEALKMLRSSIPTTIEIEDNLSADCGNINADPMQLHQIMLNLGTNAFHAMEAEGGVLRVGLRIADSVPPELKEQESTEEQVFIELTCSDTGHGIDAGNIDKIFDPFFTTKAKGKGTGMGLATTYGIVKDCDGIITVDSKPGKGTAFTIYLPQTKLEAAPETADDAMPLGANERILFIDDEKVLVHIGRKMLERLGYRVTAMQDSIEALKVFQEQPDAFDLVISDQTMPGMTGVTLAQKMLQIRPDIPIILSTGFSPLVDEEEAKAMGVKEFMPKPFSMGDIAKLIRKALGENS